MRIKTTTAILLNGFQNPAPQGSVAEVEAEEGAALITVGYAKETTEEVTWPPNEEAVAERVAELAATNEAERNQAAGKTNTENLTPNEAGEAAAKPAKQSK